MSTSYKRTFRTKYSSAEEFVDEIAHRDLNSRLMSGEYICAIVQTEKEVTAIVPAIHQLMAEGVQVESIEIQVHPHSPEDGTTTKTIEITFFDPAFVIPYLIFKNGKVHIDICDQQKGDQSADLKLSPQVFESAIRRLNKDPDYANLKVQAVLTLNNDEK